MGSMAAHEPQATFQYGGELEPALDFFKRTRSELSTLRKCHVWTDRVQVYDVNGDYFEIVGLGYPHPEIRPVLQSINAVFRPDQIHLPIDRPFKEFKTSRRRPWAEDRVM